MNVITSFWVKRLVDLLPEYPLFCWSRRVLGGRTSAELVAELRESKIFVADFWRISRGWDESWFRITLGQPEENRALLEVLSAVVGSGFESGL